MSRIGKHPVPVPSGVECTLGRNSLTAKGKNGVLSMALSSNVLVSMNEGQVVVKPASASKQSRMMWGTTRKLIANLMAGVTNDFIKNLEITGTGYRASVQGTDLVLQLGFSHDIIYPIPADITIKCEKPTSISIAGASRQRVGQIAAEIRSYRGPEPYKGKGVRYDNEFILRKEGKKK